MSLNATTEEKTVSFDFESLRKEFTCPVSLELLHNATILIPCTHRVQQAVAEKLFGILDNGWRIKQEKKCPVCVQKVEGYTVDHGLRNIVGRIFGAPEPELVLQELPETSLTVEQEELPKLPYPGKSAKFVHKRGNWESCIDSETRCCRSVNFKSITEGSLLKEFGLLGYTDGEVVIFIKFCEKNFEPMKKYLRLHNVYLKDLFDEHSYISDSIEELRTIFKLIAENNEIPNDFFEKLREIVDKGTIPPSAPSHSSHPFLSQLPSGWMF